MDVWGIRSHLLHPLTELTSNKVKCKWTDAEQKEFEEIKHAVAHDILLAYPELNKHFDIHTDDINYQPESVISQGGKPISFYSHKLTISQTQYIVT